ncbi:MAG: peptide chain release factor N(5)-glutamine methyltransferase [Gemmatimonadota bacterium]
MTSDRPTRRGSVTLGALVAAGTAMLRDGAVQEARREALRIVADLESWTPGEVVLAADKPASDETVARCQAGFQRRAKGEPLAYVTGFAGFRHLVLKADRRALIPRPETEGLVDVALGLTRTGVVVDVGTGTGCIALALRQEGSFDRVIAVDWSLAALKLAEENRERLELEVELRQGDLLHGLGEGTLDLVVSNPPYVTSSEYRSLDAGVREFEPELALVGGGDGLELYRRLFPQARLALKPRGWIAVELAADRAHATARLARLDGWDDVMLHLDLFGRLRYLTARRGDGRS